MKIVAFVLSALVLATLSAVDLYCSHTLLLGSIYRHDFLDYLGVSSTIISLTSIIYLTLFKRFQHRSLFLQGFICILINVLLLFIITLPLVGFIGIKGLFFHLTGVSIFCFCIPLTYNAFKKILDIPIDETESRNEE